VNCAWKPEQVCVTVRDSGAWRPARLHNRGRGLMIMSELMDSAEVKRGRHGTTVTLVKRLSMQS
jgi:anti-sigma regulatory factor (Ser/Thr protein kinase)